MRPNSSLIFARIGFTTSSIMAAAEDMSPMALAVAAASPFLISNTMGARVGTHIVTADMNRHVATQRAAVAPFLAMPIVIMPMVHTTLLNRAARSKPWVRVTSLPC